MDTVATLPNRPPVWRRAAVPLLTLMLLASLGVIGYQWWGMREAAPVASPVATQQGDWNGVINAIKAPPRPGGTEMWKTNEQLARLVRDEAAMRAFPPVAQAALPGDYAYFLERSVPRFVQDVAVPDAPFRDQYVIASLPPGRKYTASIAFNSTASPFEQWVTALGAGSRANRVIVSAAYTSASGVPAGLALDKGRVINPAVQRFNGALVIDGSGTATVERIDAMPAGRTTLRVRSTYRDYVAWLTQAEAQQLSMVQSHLLVDNGEPVVDRNAQDRLSRRAVFVTPGGGLHLYDSGARQETLWDAAEFLRNNYRAVAALNLEAGPYGVVATIGGGL